MGRHAEKKSIFSSILSIIFTILIVSAIVVSIFGSWELFLIQVIEEMPFGEFLFKTIASFLKVGYDIMSQLSFSVTFGSVWNDCIKLLVAAVLLPIVKYFAGYTKEGKHAAPRTIGQKIFDFIVESVILPVMVVLLSTQIVAYISNSIQSIGGIWATILSIVGSLATIGVSVWAFSALIASGMGLGVLFLLYKIIPAILNTLFSYAITLLFLLLGSSPEYMSSIGPILILLLGIFLMLNGLDHMLGGWFRSKNESGHDWF